MKPCTSPYKHIFYNLNRTRKKSWEKYKKAMQWYVELMNREEIEGLTKWIQKTKLKAEARLKKFWITKQMIANYIANKKK